jgi:branched-chain amino acid transport system permease protein
MLLQQLINALVVGSVYALIAMGLTMVYGVLRILHIAHAAIYALGAYAGLFSFLFFHNFLIAFLIAMVICALAGILMQQFIYLPLLESPRIVPLIASIGLFTFMEDLYRLVAGPYILPFPVNLGFSGIHFFGVTLTSHQLLILVVTFILLGFVWLIIARTRIGLAWKATAQDVETAISFGVNINKIIALNFTLGSALAAAAGVLIGIYYNSVYPAMGSVPAYKMLAIVVLGGLGSVTGTVVAALIIGFAETLMVGYIGFILPRDAIAFIALILILMFRPEGLFGRVNR